MHMDPAHAQATIQATNNPVAASQPTALPSVTVTAQKREESIQDVPTAITAISGTDLLNEGIGRSASEVLNYVPNASAATQQHSRPRWWIRGVGAGQQQFDLANPVGFYLDEVYLSNASATGFPLFDLERVEVLRGPQGTLWGKNTTGGAVSVVSKKPTFNESKNDNFLKIDAGSYNDRLIQGGVGGVISDERLAGRISFHQETQDGRLHNLFTGEKDGGLSDGALRGQLLAVLSPNLEALLNVHTRKYKTDGAITTTASYAASGVFRNGYVPSRNILDVSTNADNRSDTEQNGGSLSLRWQIGKLALTSITGYEVFKTESLTDNDYTPLEISRNHTAGKSKQWSQEFRLASPREDRWNWLTGLHFFDEKIDFDTQNGKLPAASVSGLSGAPAGATFNDSVLSHRARSQAIFGSTTYNFTDQFNATVGARWTHETKGYDLNRLASSGVGSWSNLAQWWNSYTGAYAPSGTLASGTFSSTGTKSWNALTYDITPEYKINRQQRVFFKYAHGVKSGGFNTAATNLASVNTVDPEKLDSYEAGYKSELLDGQLNFNATVFHYDYKNVQVNVVGFNALAGTTVSYLQNAQKAGINGAEIEIQARPLPALVLNSSLGLLRTKYSALKVLNGGPDLSGNELVRSPHLTAQVAADYSIGLDSGARVVLGGDVRYVSRQHYYVDPQSTARDVLNQGGYGLANARVTWSSPGDKYSFSGYVNNLTDKGYKNHALPAYQSGVVNGDSVYWAPPRTVGVAFISRW